MTDDPRHDDKSSEPGPAERDGIVDQQDAVLHEMADAESSDEDAVNDTERRYGENESPA